MNIIKKTSIVMVMAATCIAFGSFGNDTSAAEIGGVYYDLLSDADNVCEIQSIESGESEYYPATSVKETTHQQYWFSNYFDFEVIHFEMDSLSSINIFTVDSRGDLTGITPKAMELFFW